MADEEIIRAVMTDPGVGREFPLFELTGLLRPDPGLGSSEGLTRPADENN